jgi:hypothetical protein
MTAAFTTGANQLFKRVLLWGALLTASIAILAGTAGWFIAGLAGLLSALVGAAISFGFVSLTALSVWLGGRLSIGAFSGIVLGGWILKVVIFLAVIGLLRRADWVDGPLFFITLVASVVGTLAIDSWVFLKARLPISEG